MGIKWFSTQARTKPFKGMSPARKKPKAPSAPKPKYKSPAPTQRLPKLQKPKVDVPFIEAPKQVGKLVVADERDASSFACTEMIQIVESRGLEIDRITWNKTHGSGDDDGLCARLASRAWPDFEALFAEQATKPDKYRRRDMREGYEADGIIGVSHPGCRCYLKVFLDDGSVWKITPDDMKPQMISAATKVDVVEPSVEEFETDVTEVEPGESEEEV
jgi:hypothetical protein